MSPSPSLADPSTASIAVDIGHSAKHYGALSAEGIPEFNFNIALSADIVKELSSSGISCFTIGENGNFLKIQNHTDAANSRNASFVLSVHHDSVQPNYLKKQVINGRAMKYCNDFRGFSLFVSRFNKDPASSLKYASSIGASLRQAGFIPSEHHAEKIKGENREWADKKNGVYYYDNLHILKNSNCPAVLLEAGIIVNYMEEKNLKNPEVRKQIAKAVRKGLTDVLNARIFSSLRLT